MKTCFRSLIAITLVISLLFLCSCGSTETPSEQEQLITYNDEDNIQFDTIYSLFHYFKSEFEDLWNNLQIDDTSDDMSRKISEQVDVVNWYISAIICEIDELDENIPFSDNNKEIHSRFNEIAEKTSLVVKNTIEKTDYALEYKTNLEKPIHRIIKLLDTMIFEDLPSKNIISNDIIKESNSYEVHNYITLGDWKNDSSVAKGNRISDSFDKVLASGYESNGDFYELVANETETYEGVSIEIGVIKNNEWLISPTSKMPFIDDDGTLYGKEIKSIYDANAKLFYIGNGCFLCESYSKSMYECMENIIYNSETKQYYEKKFQKENIHICITYNCLTSFYGLTPDYGKLNTISKENSLIIADMVNNQYSPHIEILDTNAMETSVIEIRLPDDWYNIGYVYPISEGIFAVANSNTNHNKIAFYNKEGNRIIQDDFVLQTTRQSIVFKNGECTFKILNAKDTPYTITIDKSGKVLSSVQIK